MSRSDELGPIVTEHLRSARKTVIIVGSLLCQVWPVEWTKLSKVGSEPQADSLLVKCKRSD